MNYIKKLSDLSLQDIGLVGGKNASLGELIHAFDEHSDVRVPQGYAVTVQAYWQHLYDNNLIDKITNYLTCIAESNYDRLALKINSENIRALIENATINSVLFTHIKEAYYELSLSYGEKESIVVVRSSATAEDLPDASFAGQQDSFLHVQGVEQLIIAYKKCLASLFTERAIIYRFEKGFDHLTVGMSVGIQYMVKADVGCAGVLFTLEPESGFKDVVVINAAPGLGDSLVQGTITPDEYHVFKPFVFLDKKAITKKSLRSSASTFCLSDGKILELARIGVTIENYYKKLSANQSAVDIEWAQDGNGILYIVQVRPETIHSTSAKKEVHHVNYTVAPSLENKVLLTGHSVGQKAVAGHVKRLSSFSSDSNICKDDIIVTTMTDPDWMPLLKKAAGIITENGGRTCHAAIVSRELGIPALVGARDALSILQEGQLVTLDCTQGTQGYVYEGKCPIESTTVTNDLSQASLPCSVGLIIADPDQAYRCSFLPVDEVGLVRIEFIINNYIKAHPMALLYPEKIDDMSIRTQLSSLTIGYENGTDFFIKRLAEGISTIAAAFYPRSILVRFSDFKSNEYRNLLGGTQWEPLEENPMLGLRGASRYYHPLYRDAFILECKALEYVRSTMGFTNVNVMIPFVRTVEEGRKVKDILATHGLISGQDGLQIFMMCELPSNVILLEQFATVFDGFSIGSNDLTQTTLAVDRDSGLLTSLFKEDDPAVLYMIKEAITKAHKMGKKIGICGQGPSDNSSFAQQLMQARIDSISLNIDTVVPFIQNNQWNLPRLTSSDSITL